MKNAFRGKLPAIAAHAALMVAIVACLPQTAAAASVPQLMEDTALKKTIDTPLSNATEVCESDAKWMRLNFKQLQMSAYDSLTLTSSGGDSIAIDGSTFNNKQFSTRALRGNCVQIQTFFGSSASRFQVDSYQYGTQALEETTVTVAGVGDICDSGGDCSKTAQLISDIAPVAVFTAGDNAYEDGSLAEYNREYDDYWGPFKNYTHPTPGNHEYYTADGKGYFDYFNGVGASTGIAGDRGKGYYSWDVGDWRFIALNSNISMNAGSLQETWLRQTLAANTKPCTAAVFHHPLISRGHYSGVSAVKPLWNALYEYKADLVLVGHDHNYQRYAKADPNLVAKSDGIRQILIGTGGRSFYDLSGTHSLLEASNDNTHGVLKLTLSATGYTANFVPVAGSTFTDTVTASCNAKPGSANADFSVAAASASQAIARGATSRSTLNIASSGGFAGAVTLSLTGLPSGVTYSASPNPVSVAANGSASAALTLTASSTASLGSFPVTVSAVSGSRTRSTAFTLTVSASNQPPTSNFSFVTNGLTATFTDGSRDTDGTIASRRWNFGDGSTSTATNPSRTYAAAGTYTVTLTVTDNGGATHSVQKSVTVTSGSAAAQLLRNEGFESGRQVWVSSDGVIYTGADAQPRSGSYVAWLNGYGVRHTDTLSQTVNITANKTTATLSFYLRITTQETENTPYDVLTVEVRNTAGDSLLKECATYSNLDKSTSYVKRTCDLSAFIGQSVSIHFTGKEDTTLSTSFRLDDMRLDVL